jgi:hypothetical protein
MLECKRLARACARPLELNFCLVAAPFQLSGPVELFQCPSKTWVRKFAGFNFDVIDRVIVPVPVPRLAICIVCKVPVRYLTGYADRPLLFKYCLITKI